MSAHILVVDDNPLNVKLLAAKLAKDYYIVSTAEDGPKALQMIAENPPDIVLLDVMMPEMNGFEVCTRLKSDPATRHIPVVMVTALSDVADRVHGLETGADDFLTKPINDIALMARVRSLLRLKMVMDEWRLREATAAQFSIPSTDETEPKDAGGQALLLGDNPEEQQTIERLLKEQKFETTVVGTVDDAIMQALRGTFDLVMVSLDLLNEDGLLLCGQLRAREVTRTLPILLLANADEIARVARGLDLGANDYLIRPLEGSELIARTRTQLKQKRQYDRLRKNYEHSLALALVDPLTGAFNRRYLDMHLPKMVTRYQTARRAMSVLSVDLDHFKYINDSHGHAAGDVVLKTAVDRITQSLRPMDLVVRMGGEEFAVILPETDMKTAVQVGERLRESLAGVPVPLPGVALPISISASFGIATLGPNDENMTPTELLARADAALYKAKETGRNKVVCDGSGAV